MSIAAVLLAPILSVPPAAALMLWLLWYWRRLGGGDVPESRRRIRRASTAVMLAGLPFLVVALSFLDAKIRPGAWAMTWVLVTFVLGLVVFAAGLDLFNTLRLGRRERVNRIVQDAIERARRRKESAG